MGFVVILVPHLPSATSTILLFPAKQVSSHLYCHSSAVFYSFPRGLVRFCWLFCVHTQPNWLISSG